MHAATAHAAAPAGAHAHSPLAGLTTAEAEARRAEAGFNEVRAKRVPAWRGVLRRYFEWTSIVILAAAAVSVAVPVDGAGAAWTSCGLLFFELNLVVWVGWLTERNAGDAARALEALAAPTAAVLRDGAWREGLPVRELVPGDAIALRAGDVVPADCRLAPGGAPLKVDESALTGESAAATRRAGEQLLAGAVVAAGEAEAEVTATGAGTFFGRTMALLARPAEPGHLQKVLGRSTATVGLLGAAGVAAIFGVLLARGAGAGYAVATTFVVFVAVVPIGMPVVVGAVLAVGARAVAAEGAVVTRLSALEELSGMEVLCSDKTGTLTRNRLALDEAEVAPWGGRGRGEVLRLAALSASWAATGQDAIDRALTRALGGDRAAALPGWRVARVEPFDPVSKKTVAHAVDAAGAEVVAAKGAPQVIARLLGNGPDAVAACAFLVDYVDVRAARGLRALAVAASADGGATWELVGMLALLDPPRADSAATIARCRTELGVAVKMVTGDQRAIAAETCRRLGLGADILEASALAGELDAALAARVAAADGFAGVFPEHKHLIVRALQAGGALVGMTGDGVNDAPALKRADVGIAVAGATPAAKGAADIVLTAEGVGAIATAIRASRKIFARLEAYIVYRLASSLTILGFFLVAIAAFGLEFPTWALVLVSLTNDLSAMATCYDSAHASDLPSRWSQTRALAAAAAIAACGVGALVLLLAAADPARGWNWWPAFATSLSADARAADAELVAVLYLGLCLFLHLSIFLTRTPGPWWRFGPRSAPRPSAWLAAPTLAFCALATFVAVYWPGRVHPDAGRASLSGAGWVPALVTWAYVLLWLQVADLAKWAVQRLFRAQAAATERAKRAARPPPRWARALAAPGAWADAAADRAEAAAAAAGGAALRAARCAGRALRCAAPAAGGGAKAAPAPAPLCKIEVRHG